MSALQLQQLAGLFLLFAVTGTSFAQDQSGEVTDATKRMLLKTDL